MLHSTKTAQTRSAVNMGPVMCYFLCIYIIYCHTLYRINCTYNALRLLETTRRGSGRINVAHTSLLQTTQPTTTFSHFAGLVGSCTPRDDPRSPTVDSTWELPFQMTCGSFSEPDGIRAPKSNWICYICIRNILDPHV